MLTIVPPIPVIIKRGLCSSETIIDILLCLLGWFPGVIYAYYIIATYPYEERPYIEIREESYGAT